MPNKLEDKTQPKLFVDKILYQAYCELLRNAGHSKQIEEYNGKVFEKAIKAEIEAIKKIGPKMPEQLYSDLLGGENAQENKKSRRKSV